MEGCRSIRGHQVTHIELPLCLCVLIRCHLQSHASVPLTSDHSETPAVSSNSRTWIWSNHASTFKPWIFANSCPIISPFLTPRNSWSSQEQSFPFPASFVAYGFLSSTRRHVCPGLSASKGHDNVICEITDVSCPDIIFPSGVAWRNCLHSKAPCIRYVSRWLNSLNTYILQSRYLHMIGGRTVPWSRCSLWNLSLGLCAELHHNPLHLNDQNMQGETEIYCGIYLEVPSGRRSLG